MARRAQLAARQLQSAANYPYSTARYTQSTVRHPNPTAHHIHPTRRILSPTLSNPPPHILLVPLRIIYSSAAADTHAAQITYLNMMLNYDDEIKLMKGPEELPDISVGLK